MTPRGSPPWALTGLGAPGAQAVRAICWWEGAGLASEGIWSLLRAVEAACWQDFQTLSWLGRKPGWTDARQGLLQAPGHKPLALDERSGQVQDQATGRLSHTMLCALVRVSAPPRRAFCVSAGPAYRLLPLGQCSGARTDWSPAWGKAGTSKDWMRRAQPTTLGVEGRTDSVARTGVITSPQRTQNTVIKFELSPRLVGRKAAGRSVLTIDQSTAGQRML